MELFREDGHLTDEGLASIQNGSLDELERLEACEHLSFCDCCLVRYTDALTDDALLAPERPLAESVLRRVRKRALRVLQSSVTRAAAAAVLALALWGTGIFTSLVPAREDWKRPSEIKEPAATASVYVNGFFRSAGNAISETVNGWLESHSYMKPLNPSPSTS